MNFIETFGSVLGMQIIALFNLLGLVQWCFSHPCGGDEHWTGL